MPRPRWLHCASRRHLGASRILKWPAPFVEWRSARLSLRPLVGFGWRRSLRGWVGSVAASNLASAARRGSRRGAWGYRSPSMTPRIAAITAASSSSGRSIFGTDRLGFLFRKAAQKGSPTAPVAAKLPERSRSDHRLPDLGSFLQLCQVLRMDQAAAATLSSGFAECRGKSCGRVGGVTGVGDAGGGL
jgi:hypothetical protein